jgi:hypothetical protein
MQRLAGVSAADPGSRESANPRFRSKPAGLRPLQHPEQVVERDRFDEVIIEPFMHAPLAVGLGAVACHVRRLEGGSAGVDSGREAGPTMIEIIVVLEILISCFPRFEVVWFNQWAKQPDELLETETLSGKEGKGSSGWSRVCRMSRPPV